MRTVLTILAIWLAGLGAAAQFGKISVLYDDLERTYAGAGAVGIGAMVSIVGIVGLIFGTSAGLLVARVGPRRALLGALALGALVSLVQSALPPYPLMMATRVLEGAAHLAIVVVGPTAIAGIAPKHLQGLAMTLWSSFFGLTYALLFWFGPGLVVAHGAAALFLGHAGWMAAMLVVLFFLMPPDPLHRPLGSSAGLLDQHLEIYRSPFIAAPAMGFACYTVTYVALLTLLPPALTPGWGGFVGVAMPLVSIAVSLSLGFVMMAGVGAVTLVECGFGLGLVAAVALRLSWGSGAGEAASALLLAVALGMVQGASFAALAQLNPLAEDRARGAGAIAQLGNLGTTSGTPMLALILAKLGVDGLTAFLLVFFALGVIIHLWQARRRRNHPQSIVSTG